MGYKNSSASQLKGITIEDTTPNNGDGLFYNNSTDELEWGAGAGGSDKRIVEINLLDNATDTEVGDGAGAITFTVPSEINGWDLVNAQGAVEVAGTTGTTDIQIYNVTQTVDMLTTKITIDSGELTSYTATTPPVIDTANDDVATGDAIRIDVDAISTTAAKGLKIILTFQLP